MWSSAQFSHQMNVIMWRQRGCWLLLKPSWLFPSQRRAHSCSSSTHMSKTPDEWESLTEPAEFLFSETRHASASWTGTGVLCSSLWKKIQLKCRWTESSPSLPFSWELMCDFISKWMLLSDSFTLNSLDCLILTPVVSVDFFFGFSGGFQNVWHYNTENRLRNNICNFLGIIGGFGVIGQTKLAFWWFKTISNFIIRFF